jgi:cell division protein FtsQ
MSVGVKRSMGILGLLVGLAAVVLPLAGDVMERQVLSVRVAGEFQHVNRTRLEAVVRQELDGRGFFQLDVERVRQVARALPWVREATVRRVWPDSIHIAVVERVAVARWNGDALMEDDGQVFVPDEDLAGYGLANLEGPQGQEVGVLAQYKRLAVGLATLSGGVQRVSLSAHGQWEIAFGNGMTLVPQTPLDAAALESFARRLPDILGDRLEQAARIDLRYANGFAVRWRDTQAGPEGGKG